MIKILIVDDELLVRIGLKSTLNWEEYGYTLVGEAKNAKEAIELFETHAPQILLTDINMPGMNGLELIRLLREKNPHLQSIILTHYEDFHYAREAVSLGVRDYIVKSNLTSERLLKVLKETEKHLPGKQFPSPFENRIVSPDLGMALTDLLFDQGEDPLFTASLSNSLRAGLPHEGFQLALVSFNLNINESSVFNNKQLQVIGEVSQQVLSENPFPVIRTVYRNQILYLFNFDQGGHPAGLDERIAHFMNLLKINLKKLLNYYLLIGISCAASDLGDVDKLYSQAYQAGKRAFFEPNHISCYSRISNVPVSEKMQVDWDRVKGFLLDSRNQELSRFIDMIFGEAARLKDFDFLKKNYDRFIKLAEQFLSENNLTDPAFSFGESGLKQDHFYSFYDIEAVKMHVVNVFNTILENRTEEHPAGNSYIIRKSIDYIKTHYCDNISLNNLAKNADVSRSYLSFLFKQELGENFSHYLTQIRIENAKKMLAGTNLKIYEIADRVGFDSPYYFSKVFKETAGETCKEYRNRHYGEN